MNIPKDFPKHLEKNIIEQKDENTFIVHVGNIGVDAGLCWIGDPCYVLHKEGDDKYKSIGKSWNEFCKNLGDNYPTTKSFKYDIGREGLGIVVSSGCGDGFYPVYAEISNDEQFGWRIWKVFIHFDEQGVE